MCNACTHKRKHASDTKYKRAKGHRPIAEVRKEHAEKKAAREAEENFKIWLVHAVIGGCPGALVVLFGQEFGCRIRSE